MTAHPEVILASGTPLPQFEALYGAAFPRFLRMESPRISMRWALCTRRSRMPFGQRGIADPFVPARDRQLRGEDRRTHLVTILADFPEVAALGFTQRSHGPVIDHQNMAPTARSALASSPVGKSRNWWSTEG